MELYGSEEPPEYDLSKVTAKIHILYGSNDRIASVQVSSYALSMLYNQPDWPWPWPWHRHWLFSQCFHSRIYRCWWKNWAQMWLQLVNFPAIIISILRMGETWRWYIKRCLKSSISSIEILSFICFWNWFDGFHKKLLNLIKNKEIIIGKYKIDSFLFVLIHGVFRINPWYWSGKNQFINHCQMLADMIIYIKTVWCGSLVVVVIKFLGR